MPPALPKRFFCVALVVLMVASVAVSLWVTRQSEGFGVDTMFYVSQARTLLQTGTMQIPNGEGGLTTRNLWAPLYPQVLAGMSRLDGQDPFENARWLNALLFPLSTLLVALLALRASRSYWGALAGAFIYTFAPAIMTAHVVALSESLCMAFWLLSLWLLLRYQETGKSVLLGCAALAAAGSFFTRYAAVTQIAAGGLFLLLYSPWPLRRRVVDALAFGAIAGLPLTIYQFIHRHTATMIGAANNTPVAGLKDRHPGFYGLPGSQLLTGIHSVEEWLCPAVSLPLIVRGPLMLIFFGGLIAAAFLLWKNCRAEPSRPDALFRGVIVLMLVNLLGYVSLVLVAKVFLDPDVDFSSRMHIPTFIFLLISTLAVLGALGARLRASPPSASRRYFALSGILIGAFLCLYAIGAASWVRQAADDALGLANSSWLRAPSMPLIRQLPANAPVYSNQVRIVYLQTGRLDLFIMPFIEEDPIRHVANPQYADQMAQMIKALATNHGTLIIFKADQPSLRRFANAEDLKRNPALRISAETADAVFFKALGN